MNQANLNIVNEMELDKNEIMSETNRLLPIPRIFPAKRSMLSDKAEILSVYVTDGEGRRVSQVYSDLTYRIEIISQYHEKLDNVIVGFTFINSKGTIILAANTFADSGKGISVEKDEVIRSSFSFTMPRLRSGEYAIEPAIAIGTQSEHVNLTWLYEVLSVQLSRGGYEISDLGIEYNIMNSEVSGIEFV